jgi:transposase
MSGLGAERNQLPCSVKWGPMKVSAASKAAAGSKGDPAWRRMILGYRHPPEVFHETYRFRANGEGAFSAIKRHQGPCLRARSAVMQRREARWRMIARNVDLLARSRAEIGAL